MATAIHDPPSGIRVGRLVKVTGKPRRITSAPPRREPQAPQPEEVRVLLFLGLGGAACLAVLALAGLLLVTEGSALAEVAVTTPGPLTAAPEKPSLEPVVIEPAPLPEPPVPELLPEAVAEASPPVVPVTDPPAPPPATQVALLRPEKPALPIIADRPTKKTTCEKFGTRIAFLQSPPDAFRKAKEENKQVFFVHLSGNFDDKEFT
ncbi:MAG TPA: hypothetical protein VNX28_11645 [Gemmataceae bacterium]|jgi:hypothetical protein|nr:hypothetical protein [Gemmataceae bacterium]